MSGPDDLTAATASVPATQGPLSRRSVLRTAAGAGLAAGALAASNVPTPLSLAATTRPAARHTTADHATADHTTSGHAAASHDTTDGPIVVHLRDARTGEIDIFRGTSQTRLHDHALAALLIRASR